MSDLRYTQAKKIFLAVCDLNDGEREQHLTRECGSDTELRAEVESLLTHHEPTAKLNDTPTIATRGLGEKPDTSTPTISTKGLESDTPTISTKGLETDSPTIQTSSLKGSGATQTPQSTNMSRGFATRGPRTRGGASASGRGRERDPNSKYVGPYRLVHELGRGGMGVVYLAVRDNDRFKQRVALKVLKRGMDTDEVLKRFELERQVLGALNHPGVARMYDAGETDDGIPYFAMEYIEGLEIKEYCDVHRLHIDERLKLFRKVCEAVHYAHQNLVVHRDLKPGNILVTEDGSPKLLDFGIAKLINPDMSLVSGDPTAPEFRVMTPEYASPEQVRGNPITTASDVYSLGVILYELVSGHQPYRLRSRMRADIERVVCDEEPDRPSTAISRIEDTSDGDQTTQSTLTITPESVSRTREGRPDRLRRRLAGDIDNIVLMAMRKEPQRRYQSAEALGDDIRRHLEGMPVSARADTIGYRVSKFVRRNRTSVAAAAVVAISLVGGIVGTTYGMVEAKDQRQTALKALDAETIALNEAKAARDAEKLERERAERRFDEVRALARTFMYDFHDAIVTLDGSVPARELLVTTAQDYLDNLSDEVEGHDELERELAEAYERVGSIRGGIRNPSLGDKQGALENYEQAHAIRERLAAAQPGDEAVQRDLYGSFHLMGDMMLSMGDVNEALALHHQSLAIAREIAQANPASRDDRRAVAVALGNVGAAYVKLGRSDEAKRHYEQSYTIRRELADADPDDTRAQRDLSVIALRLGGRLSADGNSEEALARYLEACTIRTVLSESDPENARWRRDVAVAHYFVTDAYLELDDPESALPHAERYVVEMKRRTEKNPNDARTVRDLAAAYDLVGRVHSRLHHWDQAFDQFSRYRETILPLADANPEDTLYRSMVAKSSERVADVQSRRGETTEAVEIGRRAMEIARELSQADADNASLRLDYARMLRKMGTWLAADNRPGEALKRLEDAEVEYTALVDLDPDNADVRNGFAAVLHELAKLMLRLDDSAMALEYAERAIDIAREPLPAVLRELAKAYALEGQKGRAIAFATDALTLLEQDEHVDLDEEELRDLLEEDLAGYRGQ